MKLLSLMPFVMFASGCVLLLHSPNGGYPALFWGIVLMWQGAENAGLDAYITELIAAEGGEGE